MPQREPLIFEYSRAGRGASDQWPHEADPAALADIPARLRRTQKPLLPEVGELETVRHFTRLSQLNFSIDTHFYPLGSCTMKYNPKACNQYAMLPEFLGRHPLAPESHGQGFLACMYELQEMLKEVTGMQAVALSPMAGAHGEFAGVAMIRAYHRSRGALARNEIIVPEAAHGTNPATATMCGCVVREIPVNGAGAVGVSARLRPFLPLPIVGLEGASHATPGQSDQDGPVPTMSRQLPVQAEGNRYRWLTEKDLPQSIGRLSGFMGNAGVLLRAYIYMRLLGREGMQSVGEYATLNANYLMARLRAAGFDVPYPRRRAGHEFIVTLKRQARELNVTAMDFAKRLLDYGFHAPTTYFPLLVPECLLIEPTETESKEALDGFVDAMVAILKEAESQAQLVKSAPHTMTVRPLDDVRAARQLDLTWKPTAQS